MNELLIAKKHEVFTYGQKEGTSSSYYFKDGERNILPERITYSPVHFLTLKQRGRVLTEKMKGQVSGSFKKGELSTYKQYRPFRLFSTVWEAKNYKEIIGYGDIGISNNQGRIKSSNDLFIVTKPCNDVLEIHLFRSLINRKDEVLKYLYKYLKEQALERAC